MCHYWNHLFPDVCQFLVYHQIFTHFYFEMSFFFWDVGALSMLIPMYRLQNSGKSLYGILWQSQCPSWFWQLHILGCVNEYIMLKLLEGSGLVKWLFGVGWDSILWGWMGWFIANYPYIYTHDNVLTIMVRLLWPLRAQVNVLPAMTVILC